MLPGLHLKLHFKTTLIFQSYLVATLPLLMWELEEALISLSVFLAGVITHCFIKRNKMCNTMSLLLFVNRMHNCSENIAYVFY